MYTGAGIFEYFVIKGSPDIWLNYIYFQLLSEIHWLNYHELFMNGS